MTAPFMFVPTFSWPAAPGGLLYTYTAGSTTPKATYTDAAGTVPNTNPVVLDANGSATVRLGSGSYNFVLKDSTGTTTIWSQDQYAASYLTASDVGTLLFPISVAEQTAGVSIYDGTKAWGREDRYGDIASAISQQDSGGDPAIGTGGGMRLKGSLGSGVRPEAQLILENTITSGHAILTMVNNKNTEESAWEAVGLLDNGGYFQHGAQFWRFIGDDNGATTYKSVWAVHVTRYGADNCPLIVSSNNGVLVCGGDTTTKKWATELTANWFDIYTSGHSRTSHVVGPNHAKSTKTGFAFEVEKQMQVGSVDGSGVTDAAVQLGYSVAGSTCYLQAYSNSGSALAPLQIAGSEIDILAGSHIIPTTNNSTDLGTNAHGFRNIYSVNAVTVTSDQRVKEDAGEYTPAELAWGRKLKTLMRKYRMKAEPGGKIRFGVYAQEVVASCEAEGLNPNDYEFIVYENGSYAIQYDPMLCLIIAAL